jgi:hypothetical protein
MLFRLYEVHRDDHLTAQRNSLSHINARPERQVLTNKTPDSMHQIQHGTKWIMAHSYSTVPAACLWFLSNLLLRLLSAGSSPPTGPVPLGLIPDHVP